ncbi:MAG: DUF1127 domain-containing protein [Paracoccaceae bacterium]|jgi:uncharacterized protein YjiS (DUF1127 family)|nr:DUF1127 domain-containing protein [Paracoccaceae bacterium]
MSTRSLTRFAPQALSLSALLRHLSAMRAARHQRIALARLDVAALKDIGITPEQAEAELRRAAWDVTPSWRA